MYHYTDGGLRNVWLVNGYEIKKTPYGEGVAFHNLDGLTRSICMALTRKASLLTGPIESVKRDHDFRHNFDRP